MYAFPVEVSGSPMSKVGDGALISGLSAGLPCTFSFDWRDVTPIEIRHLICDCVMGFHER